MRKTGQRGYSLMEVMVVCGIIGVMVGIAIPSVLAWMPAANLKDAAYDVRNVMIQARSGAVNKGLEHRVLFDLADGTYRMDRGNLSSGSATWTTVIGPFPLANGITYQSASAQMELAGSDPFVRFQTNGGVTSNVDTLSVVLINAHSDLYKVSVQRRTGHASMIKGG